MIKKNVPVTKVNPGDRIVFRDGTGEIISVPRLDADDVVLVVKSGGTCVTNRVPADDYIQVFVRGHTDSWEEIPVDYAVGEEATVVD